MSFCSYLYYALEKVNFLPLFIFELGGIAALFVLNFRKKLPREYGYLLIVMLLMILWRAMVFGDGTARRHYAPLALLFIWYLPFLFDAAKKYCSRRVAGIAIGVISVGLLAFSVGKSLRAERPNRIFHQAMDLMQDEFSRQPGAGTPELFGNTGREAQIVFYLHLPLQIKWMPNRKSSKWTSAQYLREYAFRYRKHIDPGTEIILLLEDQAPEDLEQTLLFLQQQHRLKLTVHRRLERLDLCRLSADPISEGKVSQ